MEEARFLEILNDPEDKIKVDLLMDTGCNVMKGMFIIAKYLPESGIEGASHDVIYCCSIESIITAGITEEDAIKLRRLNWMTIDDCRLACFV